VRSLARTLATSSDLHQGLRRSPHPPIADYAFLSDCESNCLIVPSGAVEWMCLPRHDSPSVFGAILDRAAGSFRLGPYRCPLHVGICQAA
jgi:GH15 family glucan-1,4-alpha-glucosidase